VDDSAQFEPGVFALARAAYDHEDYELAASLYNNALNEARAADAPEALADAAFNMAACLYSLERYDENVPLLHEAERACRRTDEPVYDIRLLLAKTYHAQGDVQSAQRLAREALEGAGRAIPSDSHAGFHLLMADIACDNGDPKKAAKHLEQFTVPSEPSRLTADCHRLRGRIALLQNSPETAARAFDAESTVRRTARQYDMLGAALNRAAHAYEQSGQLILAADRYYRAARSHFAKGRQHMALRTGLAAVRCAEASHDDVTQDAASNLVKDVQAQLQDGVVPTANAHGEDGDNGRR